MTELFFSDQTRVHFALARTEGLCGPVRYPDFAALWHEGRLGPLPQPEPFPDDLLLSLDLALGSIRGGPLSIADLIIHLWRRHPNAHGNEVLGPRVEELLRAGKLRLVHRSQEHFFDCVVALPDGAAGGPLPPLPPVPETSTPSARPNCVVFTSHFK